MPWNLILNLGVKLVGAYFNNRKEKKEERKYKSTIKGRI